MQFQEELKFSCLENIDDNIKFNGSTLREESLLSELEKFILDINERGIPQGYYEIFYMLNPGEKENGMTSEIDEVEKLL